MPELLLNAVRAFAAQHGLFDPPPRYVAVSGGVDSVVLLHVLVDLGQRPVVISCDHGLRPEAAAELQGVAALSRSLGLDFVGLKLDVGPGPDLAARARAARYAAWEALPEGDIALGHQLDDQAETVLDHLIRGAGAGGLAGIRPRRGRFVRPLLGTSRAEILRYAQLRGLSWVEDPSNQSGQRGRLRGEILPGLESLRAGAGAQIARAAGHLAEDDALLFQLAAALRAPDGLRWADTLAAPAPLQRRAILSLVADTRGGPPQLSACHIDAALALRRSGSSSSLPQGWFLVLDGDRLRCLPPRPGPTEGIAGSFGVWRFESEAPVRLRPVIAGERQGQTLVSRSPVWTQEHAGLRPYHPVVEREDRRWIVGQPAPKAPPNGVHVRIWRSAGPSWPGGGPYEATI